MIIIMVEPVGDAPNQKSAESMLRHKFHQVFGTF